jgi:hypothetical protein
VEPQTVVGTALVCKYFLKSEFQKGTFGFDPSALGDDQIHQEMTSFGKKQPNNPTVVWLGYSPTNHRKPVTWKHVREISVRTMMSKGLNPAWNPQLQAVNGNLYRFVKECQTTYKTEFDASRSLSGDLSLIIGIVHPASPKEVELVDGSHRLASMILNNIEYVEGYLGYY